MRYHIYCKRGKRGSHCNRKIVTNTEVYRYKYAYVHTYTHPPTHPYTQIDRLTDSQAGTDRQTD